ncbi:MAG: hypothetical protein ACKVQW_06570 [Pyrinomonadaceae bacterium]
MLNYVPEITHGRITDQNTDRPLRKPSRKNDISDDDLRLLDLYRRDFFEAYEIVIGTIREKLSLEPTGRPAKSTTSISDKLRRESIRLSQVQDIAGCRLIVADIAAQDATVELLKGLFENIAVVDRRKQPSHGYRAVHAIVKCHGRFIEIQIRTQFQHLWAELSEKFSDVVDPAIKYGGGDKKIQSVLINVSDLITAFESLEIEFTAKVKKLSSKLGVSESGIAETREFSELREELDKLRLVLLSDLNDNIKNVTEFKRLANDISD